jgi:hypothetical protein
VHGITGSLGWALAPAMLVPLTLAYSWRVALSAPARCRSRCCVLWLNREQLALARCRHASGRSAAGEASSTS